MTDRIQKFLKSGMFNRYYSLSRGLRSAAVIIAFVVLSIRAFAHLDIHMDVPHGTWENIERHERAEAYEKFQNEPERCTERELVDAFRHEMENTA